MSAEQHVYPPSAEAMKNAWVSGMPAVPGARRRGRGRPRGLLGAPGARADSTGGRRSARVLNADDAAVLQVVRGRHAERLVQLPRPARRATASATRRRSSSRPTTARSAEVTYAELLERTCRLANALKARGLVKGDRVVIYMPMSVEGVVAMLACARIGATHSVVFGGFSAQ